VKRARYDMAVKSVADGQPLRVVQAASPNWTSSGQTRGNSVTSTGDDGLSGSDYLCYYPTQSIIGH